MLPLGGTWTGRCKAPHAVELAPSEGIVRCLCNLGYARGACSRFPLGDGPDAVRFTISGDDGVSLRLYYVVERDHHPFSHGPLEFSLARRAFIDPPTGEIVTRQASAYVESYLRRKMEASER